MDLVLGPFHSAIVDPVADVTEKHKIPMLVPVAGASSIYRKGRKFVFSVQPLVETRLDLFGRFRVDRDGVQIGQKMLLVQWQDGKRAIVWPEELAPSQPRFQRRRGVSVREPRQTGLRRSLSSRR